MRKKIIKWIILTILILCLPGLVFHTPTLICSIGHKIVTANEDTHIGGIPIDEIIGKSDFTNSKYKPCYTVYENDKPVESYFFVDFWYGEFTVGPGHYQQFPHGEDNILICAYYGEDGVITNADICDAWYIASEVDLELLPLPACESLYEFFVHYFWITFWIKTFIKALFVH
ncbi:MAG: hypothetical protein E7312_04775 [Clostridiales bacterium]|nr:hypothetical protein [Clostridiales bacterium]